MIDKRNTYSFTWKLSLLELKQVLIPGFSEDAIVDLAIRTHQGLILEVMASELPLHRAVWEDSPSTLQDLLKEGQQGKCQEGVEVHQGLEEKDKHGRTPLMLAVSLGRLECTRILLDAAANVNTECDGWTVVQEATATGDPELVQLVLDQRDRQRYSTRIGGIPDLLKKLKDAPDFYVEMTWEFTSWVPLVSRMCPSDTYRVYKRGSSVRVDTTLLGFDQNSWVRGSRSYIFTGTNTGAKFLEIDHDTQQVYAEEMAAEPDVDNLKFSTPEQVSFIRELVLHFQTMDLMENSCRSSIGCPLHSSRPSLTQTTSVSK